MSMNEQERLRFLRRALDEGLIGAEEHRSLMPRMICKVGCVLQESERQLDEDPEDAQGMALAKQELVGNLANCVLDVVRQHGGNALNRKNRSAVSESTATRIRAKPVDKSQVDHNSLPTSKPRAPAQTAQGQSFAFPTSSPHDFPRMDPLQVAPGLRGGV